MLQTCKHDTSKLIFQKGIFRMHTMYIDLHKVLSSVRCVNIVLYQKMQK